MSYKIRPVDADAGLQNADAVLQNAEIWATSPSNSARTVLVTVLGDTIAPLAHSLENEAVWLGDLAAMVEVFGFNERLVRTSISRLAADGWISSERVGRRSRYRLTAYGNRETRQAERRIYGPLPQSAAEAWRLVFAGPEGSDPLTTHLRWRGFAEISAGVWAHPEPIELNDEDRRLADPFPATAIARFDQPSMLALSDTFRRSTGLDQTEAAYHDFLEVYGPLARFPPDTGQADPGQDDTGQADTCRAAFALRTMLVHDYRRIRLAEPDLGTDVLGPDWIGRTARTLVSTTYRRLAAASWSFITSITGASAPIDTRRFPDFTSVPTRPDLSPLLHPPQALSGATP